MSELTLARTKELLAAAVAEKGADYVYTNRHGDQADADGVTICHYVHAEDKAGCIVGHVLHKAGVSLADLAEYEGQSALEPIAALVIAGADVMKILVEVQRCQDRGVPWGEAVRRVLAAVEA